MTKRSPQSSRTEEGQAVHLPPDRLALDQFYWCEARYCTPTTGHKFLQQTFFSASTLFLPLTGDSFDLQLHLPDHIFIKLALTSDNWHHLVLNLSSWISKVHCILTSIPIDFNENIYLNKCRGARNIFRKAGVYKSEQMMITYQLKLI